MAETEAKVGCVESSGSRLQCRGYDRPRYDLIWTAARQKGKPELKILDTTPPLPTAYNGDRRKQVTHGFSSSCCCLPFIVHSFRL